MAATIQQQLDALNNAVLTGGTRVKYPDGTEVTYPSLQDVMKARNELMAEQLATDNGGAFVRTAGARFS